MTGNEYQELAMRTNDGGATERLIKKCETALDENINIGDLTNGVEGLTGEAGEVADLVKKFTFHGHSLDIADIKKELGDVMWYVAMCCNAIGAKLDDIMQGNVDKLRKRYPEGFSQEASINRTE